MLLTLTFSSSVLATSECENKLNNANDAHKKAINIFNNGSEIYSQIDLLDGNLVKQCKEYKKLWTVLLSLKNIFKLPGNYYLKLIKAARKKL